MEKDQDIKRGVDFEMRFGRATKRINKAFLWWRGGPLGQRTLIFIVIAWALNFVIIFPIFSKDLTHAYSGSVFLTLVSELFQRFFLIKQQLFFSLLTAFSITFAPISFYLFVRKIAMRHEITALIATLIFILPNPVFNNVPILVAALLRGDGAHIVAISFIPFFLLYIRSFISSGATVFFFTTAIIIASIAVVSPFATFNLLIMMAVLTLAEGFQGNLRIKLIRAFFLLLTAGALSFFWYYPNMIIKILSLSHIQYSIGKFTGILPAAIPIIPIAGVLSFLIFDRREILKPVFVSLSFFLIYLAFYGVSSHLNVSGIFTAGRYLPELVLSSSFFLAVLFIPLTEFVIRLFLKKLKGKTAFYAAVIIAIFFIVIIGFLSFQGIGIVHKYIQSEKVLDRYYNSNTAGSRGFVDINDPTSIFASLVSLITFFFLMYIVRRYPMSLKRGR